MQTSLDQDSVRELMNKSAINAVKLLTSNQSMKQTYYIKISDVPRRLKWYDIMIKLQKEYKLNFITSVHNCQSSNNIRSMVIGIKNDIEFRTFMSRGEVVIVKGYRLIVEETRRPLGMNFVRVPEELKGDVKKLPRVISFDAGSSYSKVFPEEMIIEILIEMEADGWILNGLEGIWLKYIHHERRLDDKVIMSVDETISFNVISRFLVEYGSTEVKKRSLRIIMTYKSVWQNESVYEINDEEEAVYSLTKGILERDMLLNEENFNNIRGVLEG
ncbi:unnamed protein product [Chironomus riparius]|uniref:Uncharacterized protein n=1 Tax=Chironomus riparius TaxID=315576 RepID=A0A9N9RLY8_9DIPT|nr:unnamed protein product [Chironomus riparius]